MCAKGTKGPQLARRACHFFLVRSVTYVSGLDPQEVVDGGGFEPPTSSLRTRRSAN
jgi:hypothetical protein